ncbi:hypothetical protein Sipo8835_27725 [Streptomyces ipomoeae]|jgi:hypothetical protein|uniref:ABM domain-containing protein n=2 Tax=Streptomyces ipomoeae TaxID=103232 RepID=L1L1E7_9ACTN|nr:hypothetical protein [Streptomyces ipomoeae]EKX66438.1 hypothetical protein STRIP9103_02689 [Streptomyces ipomoeae 91-03]MDX2697530.1 hypothetical protein [Streptomyces ipomoeae]MDX2826546.1 hypothetical protein [Streptomyces ipomoeae]MDX2844815.1 hypothetical protein [Streptomyces ipomoeae]MDX2881337.1 hypothetical protein [Streptomyces ipomoeae]
MAVLVHSEGADWNQELYQATFDRVIPDRSDPPAGLIAHFAGPVEQGGWQVVDVWESEEAFRRFMEEAVLPAAKDLGAPPFDSHLGEVRNSLIP